MSVKYTNDQKAEAKARKQKLVAIDTGGIEFSGPVTPEEHLELTEFMLTFVKKRSARIAAEAKATTDKPK